MTDDAQPDNGSASEGVLDLDAATSTIAALDERPEDEGEEKISTRDESPDVDEETEAEPTAEDSEADPEEATDADVEGDDTEADEPLIQPPHSWDKEAKERFAKLDRETQEYLVNRENERDRAVSQKFNEAAEIRKQAEAEASKAAQYAQIFDQLAHQAQQQFADRWQNVDWQRLAEDQPAEYVRLKAQYDTDQHTLQRTQQAQQAAERQAHGEFLQREGERLKDVAPELADPEKGAERRKELAQYLVQQGVTTEQLKWASAGELAIAHKAYLWDRAQTQPAKTPPVQQKTAPRAVKPAAEAKTKPRKAQEADVAMKRLSKTGSLDAATDAILALQR